MSYDPSHRMPPRQERWPQATPAEGWPPPRDGEGEPQGRHSARAQQSAGGPRRPADPRSAVATAAFPVAGDGYRTAAGGDPGAHRTGTYDTGTYGTGAYDTGAYDTGAYNTGAFDTGGYRVGDYTAGTRARESYDYPGTADGHAGTPDGYAGTANGYAGATNGLDGTADGSGDAADSYGWARVGYAASPGSRAEDRYGQAGDGYGRPESAYGRAADGYGRPEPGFGRAEGGSSRTADGYAGAGRGAPGYPDSYPGSAAYLGPGSYTETTYSSPVYADPGYADPGYADAGYSSTEYSGTGYSEPGFPDHDYPDPGYSDTGYSDPGYSDPEYPGSGYSDTGYFGSGYSDPLLVAPDAGVHPDGWQADQASRRAARYRGLLVSATTEILAAAVVIGVSTLAAGLLKSMISPVSALGTVFVDRTPAMLRGFAMHHFGSHGHTVLLLGMYAVIAVIAIAIGVAARRAAALGVTGIAAFALVVAFATVTRPASHVSDVMPAVIGGLAGIAALLWLVRASSPIQETTPLRPARGGTRRRTR